MSPMSTPPPQPPPVHSTPISQGVSSHGENSNHTLSPLHPLLIRDLQQYQSTVAIEIFQEKFLPVSVPGEYAATIGCLFNDPSIQSLSQTFCQAGGHETESYQPFASMANAIMRHSATINMLRGKPKLTFCREDPKYVRGSIAQRKPDVVLVREDAKQLRDSMDLPSGPDPPFYWDDLYCCVEFKRSKSSVTREKTSTSQSLTVSQSGRGSGRLSSPVARGGGSSQSQSNSRSGSGSGSSSKRRADDLPPEEPQTKSRRIDDPNVDERKQSASYALEMLSSGRIRSHVINMTFDGTECRVWYYHRGGIVVSEAFDLKSGGGFRLFIDVIVRMACLTLAQWGVHPFITYPDTPLAAEREPTGSRVQPNRKAKSNTQYNENNQGKTPPDYFSGSTITVDGAAMRLGAVVTRQYTLVGRGTIVIEGHSDAPGLAGRDLMIKISWPSTDRASEADIINEARGCAEKNDTRAILDHIPEVLRAQDYSTTPVSDGGARTRTLRVIVMERFQPMTSIKTLDDFVKVMIDVVECHQALCEEAKILHRDISQNNIMVRRDEADTIFGIIIDFDLAIVTEGALSRNSPSSYEITGTLPFMAIDRLIAEDKKHLPRHDLESFFWLIVLFTSRHHEGKTVDNPPFQEWYRYDAESLAKTKALFLRRVIHYYRPTPHFECLLRAWVHPLGKILNDGTASRDNILLASEKVKETYDHETLEGLITHEAFLNTQRAHLAAKDRS